MIAGVTSWLFDAGLSPSLIDAEARPAAAGSRTRWEREILEALGDAMRAGVDRRAARGPEAGARSLRRTIAATTPSRCCACCRFSPTRRSSPARDAGARGVDGDGHRGHGGARGGRRARRPRRRPVVVARRERIAGPRGQDGTSAAGRHPARRRGDQPRPGASRSRRTTSAFGEALRGADGERAPRPSPRSPRPASARSAGCWAPSPGTTSRWTAEERARAHRIRTQAGNFDRETSRLFALAPRSGERVRERGRHLIAAPFPSPGGLRPPTSPRFRGAR